MAAGEHEYIFGEGVAFCAGLRLLHRLILKQYKLDLFNKIKIKSIKYFIWHLIPTKELFIVQQNHYILSPYSMSEQFLQHPIYSYSYYSILCY
jgi:hypothetical protein